MRPSDVTATEPQSKRLAIHWLSPAKVNLSLRIVGRRPDGYHLLDSVFVMVDLYDRIAIAVSDVRKGGRVRVDIRCDFPGVPDDASNLAARAATALLEAWGLGAEVRLRIAKRIPPGSGLGGGSGNAATVLRGLPRLLGLAIAPDLLADLALRLGADVPFFLGDSAARVRGIGERIEAIRGWPGLPLVVVIPPVTVSTARAFAAFASRPCAAGSESERLAASSRPTAALMVNDLEQVVLPEHPAVADAKAQLLAAGATAAVMSGSGSAVVGLAETDDAARRLAAQVGARLPGARVHVCRVLSAAPPIAAEEPAVTLTRD